MDAFVLSDRTVDLSRQVVQGPRGELSLTDNEVLLLRALLERAGQMVDREVLRTVLGIHPQVNSRAVHHAITRLRKKLGAESITTVRGEGYRLAVPRSVVMPTLLGRSALLAKLERLISTPLITLQGPGGIGKTRLAKALSEGRGVLVELVTAELERDVLWMVGQALGTPPRSADIQQARAEIVRAVERQGVTLLVLDNLEHIVDAVRPLARALGEVAGLTVVGTSRIPLGLPGEVLVDVGPLSATAARTLFDQTAARVGASGPDEATLAALLALLDGVPLAIEMAASRSRSVDASDLLARLQARPELLRHHAGHTVAQRHRTLGAVFEVSWSLLSAAEQAALAALTVFTGPFSLSAAEAVLGEEAELLLEALLQHSLVHTRDTASGLRYRQFSVTRSFAARHLSGAALQTAQRRHLDWFSRRAEALNEALVGPRGDLALAGIREDYAELQVAARRGCALDVARVPALLEALHYLGVQNPTVMDLDSLDAAIRSAAGRPAVLVKLEVLRAALLGRSQRLHEAIRSSDGILSASVPLEPATRIQALLIRSSARNLLGEDEASRPDVEEALACARASGLEALEVSALATMATHATRRGELERIEALLLAACDLSRQRMYPRAVALLGLSITYNHQKRQLESAVVAREALALLEALQDHWNHATAARAVADGALIAGNFELARPALHEALRVARRAGHAMSEGFCLGGLAMVALHDGRLDVAEQHAAEALLVHRLSRRHWAEVSILQTMALLIACRGDRRQAEGMLQRAEGVLEGLDIARWHGRQAATRALVAAMLDDPEAARRHREHAATLTLDDSGRDYLSLVDACMGAPLQPVQSVLARLLGSRLGLG